MRRSSFADTLQIVLRKGWPWLLRLIVLIVLCGLLIPSPIYVVVGPQQTVETEHPITCVHTRLTDEVEEWKIQRTLEMAREMGATTIVEFFPWSYIEPAPGQYNWEHADLVVNHARAQGLTIIARLGLVPDWAQPDPDEVDFELTYTYLDREHDEDFANFVEVFTERYRGEIEYVIIWNEPNLTGEWGFQQVDPARYVDLLRVATPAAKRGNPDVIVLAGALAPTLEPEGSAVALNDIDYLTGVYEAGAQGLFDVLAAHTYGFKFPPDDPPAADVMNYRRLELLREIMVDYGDGDVPVMITESGWNDHPRWTKAVRPGQRITYTIGSIEYAEENWPWVDSVCIWAFRYPVQTRSYPDYYTLVADDFTPKLIYSELQAWVRGWDTEPVD